MTEWEQVALAAAGAAALALLAGVLLLRARAAHRREVATARAEAADLRHRLDELERAVTARSSDVVVATPLEVPVPTAADHPVIEGHVVDGRLFADLVLRESVVRAASWAAGVRRALSPQNRNRIAFEMRREVKRSRRARRAEVAEAMRAHRARQRATPAPAPGSEDAA